MRGFLKPLLVVAVYHLIVGLSVLSAVRPDKPFSMRQQAEFIVIWPIVVAATNYMQAQYVTVMEDIKETLNELNSGQWERKTP